MANMVSELRDIDFEKISRLVYEQSGINLHAGKKELVKARLGKRLREGNFKSFADYYRYVTTEMGINELVSMIDSISTNLTSFFREETHFRKLREVIPALIETSGNGCPVPRLKIWSAGCSTGEEPYSLAIILREIADGGKIDPRILATDISTKALKTALAGVYPKERLGNISPLLLRKYFQIGQNHWSGYYRAKNNIKDIINFRRFNLMETQTFNSLFDAIFCRNVMIYFDKETQDGLVNKFYDSLKQGGYFFVGHSESLTGLPHRFKYVEPSVYRK
ncbi:MAG: chemotaxis protein methyltransferase CheR [Desulfobacteraceae bacterium Eth-SRB1]|nr:MAG: chemotaxis protein methyltransferase CheR [Desulfobacteraceae bacterium Eth-SRB1]